jgi:hypothetical protein
VFPVRYGLNSYYLEVYLCVPYGSHKKTATVSLNSIDLLGFVAEAYRVTCEVQTGC